MGDRVEAGLAPRPPEVEEDEVGVEVAEPDRLAVEVRELEVEHLPMTSVEVAEDDGGGRRGRLPQPLEQARTRLRRAGNCRHRISRREVAPLLRRTRRGGRIGIEIGWTGSRLRCRDRRGFGGRDHDQRRGPGQGEWIIGPVGRIVRGRRRPFLVRGAGRRDGSCSMSVDQVIRGSFSGCRGRIESEFARTRGEERIWVGLQVAGCRHDFRRRCRSLAIIDVEMGHRRDPARIRAGSPGPPPREAGRGLDGVRSRQGQRARVGPRPAGRSGRRRIGRIGPAGRDPVGSRRPRRLDGRREWVRTVLVVGLDAGRRIVRLRRLEVSPPRCQPLPGETVGAESSAVRLPRGSRVDGSSVFAGVAARSSPFNRAAERSSPGSATNSRFEIGRALGESGSGLRAGSASSSWPRLMITPVSDVRALARPVRTESAVSLSATIK